MTEVFRTPGKLGALPLDPANYAKAVPFARFKSKAPSAVQIPTSIDNLAAIASRLLMLGNDQYGDCVSVAIANLIFLVTGTYPNLQAVYKFYASQNPRFPNDDGGMVIQTALEYLVKVGMQMPDGTMKKALLFAKVDHTNSAEVEEAIALFGGLIYGIEVYDENQTEFSKGQDWTWKTSFQDDGGHGVVGGGYSGNKTKFGTWGVETEWDAVFDAHCVSECWVVLFEENAVKPSFWQGVDEATLVSEFTRLFGVPFPVLPPTPGPTPTPTPTPAPVPGDADSELAEEAVSYLKSKRNQATKIGQALAAWKTAKGL